jgi:hypothetical protein
MEESSMSSVPMPSSLRVEKLLQAVDRLSAAERLEFQRLLAGRQTRNGSQAPDQASLIEAAQARLPAAAERRLKKLIARSERGQLTPQQLADYQALAQEAQRIDAARAEALAELARCRGESVETIQSEIEREGTTDGA